MFITELANIYSKKPYLSNIVPFHDVAPQIEQFLIQEVRLGANNLNPYRFSYKFAHPPKDIINLFVAFSADEGPLKKLYRYDCMNCDATNIMNDEELLNFKCYNCSSSDDMESQNFLENVRVIFEIKEPYLKEIKIRLKGQASSDKKVYKGKPEGAINTDVTLKDIMGGNTTGEIVIDPKLLDLQEKLMHKISIGINNT
ncbi:hypothetical protein EI200_19705 [Peribacillus simplex]|uniref:hypothetical protein n=1 Tax=Peribacillus simplex TaxID=1478 RepID=UPI000F6304E0|nr:hypothetical protein [Peribacillus simplex]RRN68445.1 hypothetical protein EI200_19705 [Peribacillus simplex]